MAKRSQVSNVPCELNEQAITQGQRRRGQPWLEVKPHIERKRKAVDAVVARGGLHVMPPMVRDPQQVARPEIDLKSLRLGSDYGLKHEFGLRLDLGSC